MTEHHFQPEGAENSPNPLMAEAAVAALTSRIRLGQAANILTWWDPIRLAEMVAALDVISGGRVEFGIGRGYQAREVETFGRLLGSSVQDQERNRAYFEEAWEVIKKAWTEPSFAHQGTFFQIPPSYAVWDHPMTQAYFKQKGVERTLDDVLHVSRETGVTTLRELQVFPKPLQRPYPQPWMPIVSERSIRWAARNGINAYIVVEHGSRLRHYVELYMEEAESHGWPDRLDRGEFKYGWDASLHRGFITGKWVMITNTDNERELHRKADAGLRLQWDYYLPFGIAQALCEVGEEWPKDKRPTAQDLRDRQVLLIGSPEEVAERILTVKETGGFEDFMFNTYFDFGGMEGPELEEQIQIYAEEVMPLLSKECGGGVENPASTVQLVPSVAASRVGEFATATPGSSDGARGR
jgi:alkanesulfonate monooxygenase SsuD/methylene tetrahydromethanopterin reductase-like flavin-dependent oxidoreductase (luciferase family)